MLKCSTPYNRLTIHSHMPIPERVRKPDSVIAEEEARLKSDASAFRPAWMQHMDRFNIPYKALGYSIVIHLLAIYALVSLLS